MAIWLVCNGKATIPSTKFNLVLTYSFQTALQGASPAVSSKKPAQANDDSVDCCPLYPNAFTYCLCELREVEVGANEAERRQSITCVRSMWRWDVEYHTWEHL